MDKLMKKMGFMMYESSAETENELFPPILFERQLSLQTSLILEGELNGKGDRYEFSFYKIKYVYQTNAIKEVKVYLSGGSEDYAVERVFGWLLDVGLLPSEVTADLKKKLKKMIEKNLVRNTIKER